MKYLNIYENFNEINNLCEKYFIKNYSINSDGSVDVDGNVNLAHSELKEIPIKFKRINGDFYCDHNNISSLKNSPVYVDDEFHCGYNELTTLLNGPKRAKRYCCYDNNLKDLYGFPEYVSSFLLFSNPDKENLNPVCEIIKLCVANSNWSVAQVLFNNHFKDIYIKFIRLLNEYQVIRNGDSVVELRLMEALYEIGIENLDKELEFKNYRLI